MSANSGAKASTKTRSHHFGEMLALLDHTTPVGSGWGGWKRRHEDNEADHGFDETQRARATKG